MGTVTATAERTIDAPADRVRELVRDYSETRPKILTEHYRDYRLVEGGSGAGTVAHWKLQATSKRVRDVAATISEPQPGTVVETDANSSMVTTWTVRESDGRSVVRIETSWQGAGGIGGFFEKTFAPSGLRRIYDGVLANLEQRSRQS
ncbi:Polyketide cyclase / dehydrase and lipid transport [Saccharomonospora marina XMU15]|uniref:Polyketide cyclase / dehydrase and lipid transport n=1 Tax=Saccharomonospora marina XMU15 TaxID=882083 RepID=H5X3D0_9PSEU|nr:SRPBCC family protein [Saccharomonospora marina]EHR48799.1 Polyketide cyclase / dehydrase and lipid transport [Saccharomonospora marina XMU15]